MKELFEKIIFEENNIFSKIKTAIIAKEGIIVTYFNQHCFNIAYGDKKYLELLKKYFTVFAADFGILFFYSLFFKKIKIYNATDLNKKIIDLIIENKKEIILIGGDHHLDEIKELCIRNNILLSNYYNGYNFNFFDLIDKIKENSFNIIFLGMGVPKQEFIAKQIFEELPNSLIICVGNFFEFYFGFDKRAPKILINIGLEWFYRLIKNPSKFWKRYIIGIPLFIFRFLKLRFIYDEN